MRKNLARMFALLLALTLTGCGSISLFSSPETHHHFYFQVDRNTLWKILKDPDVAAKMREGLNESGNSSVEAQ